MIKTTKKISVMELVRKKHARQINAILQAKIWRKQMKGQDYNKVTRELIRKLKAKYPELPISDIEHISMSVI
jgi:hypothetical protein